MVAHSSVQVTCARHCEGPKRPLRLAPDCVLGRRSWWCRVKDQQEVLAHDERQGAIDDMRARFRAISEQIANELAALSRSAPQLPSAERTAVLSAANQIAKTQEGLCAETARAPIALELSLGVMQDLLQGLLHLGGIVKQQAPSGLDPELIARSQIARSQIALLTRAMQEQQERVAAGLLTRLTQDLHRRVSDDADGIVS